MLPQNTQPFIDLGFSVSKNENYLINGNFKVYESPLKNEGNIVFDTNRFLQDADVINFVNAERFFKYFNENYGNVS